MGGQAAGGGTDAGYRRRIRREKKKKRICIISIMWCSGCPFEIRGDEFCKNSIVDGFDFLLVSKREEGARFVFFPALSLSLSPFLVSCQKVKENVVKYRLSSRPACYP